MTGKTLHIPPHMLGIINQLCRAQKQLAQKMGREPAPAELADEMHLPVARVHALLKLARQPAFLLAPAGAAGDVSLGVFIPGPSAENPADGTAFP